MEYIALFFPSIISVGIYHKKDSSNKWDWFEYLFQYAFFLICNVLLTESLISYVLKMGAVTSEAFQSFPFFTKYLFIASAFAVALPYIRKIIRENISVSFEIHRNTAGSNKYDAKNAHEEMKP